MDRSGSLRHHAQDQRSCRVRFGHSYVRWPDGRSPGRRGDACGTGAKGRHHRDVRPGEAPLQQHAARFGVSPDHPQVSLNSMPIITFIRPDDRSESIEARIGESAMLAATRHGVDEIVAECGGNAMCATCHVYVDDNWISRLAAMSDEEDALLDGVAAERQPNSRLSCQIKIGQELDGLVLRLPERQL